MTRSGLGTILGMGVNAGFIRVVDVPDLQDAVVDSVGEDGDSVTVTLRRTRRDGREAGRSTPRIRVHFGNVKDVDARREVRMIVSRLVEMQGEPPWRRFVFVPADEGAGSSMEIWARDVEWSDVERHPCPCCGYRTIDYPPPGTHEICPVCDWQDDDVQARDPWFAAGPNRGESLYQRRAAFVETMSNDPAKQRAFNAEWGPPIGPAPAG